MLQPCAISTSTNGRKAKQLTWISSQLTDEYRTKYLHGTVWFIWVPHIGDVRTDRMHVPVRAHGTACLLSYPRVVPFKCSTIGCWVFLYSFSEKTASHWPFGSLQKIIYYSHHTVRETVCFCLKQLITYVPARFKHIEEAVRYFLSQRTTTGSKV